MVLVAGGICACHDDTLRLIALGPEGGSRGGTIVAEGTPEDIAANPASHTGRVLAPLLGLEVAASA